VRDWEWRGGTPPVLPTGERARPLTGKMLFHLKYRVSVNSERYFSSMPSPEKC